MAIRYFSSTASSGDGSLRAVVANALDGDVVTPDPSAFADVDTIVVPVNSQISVSRNIAIDSGPFRLQIYSPLNSYILRTSGNIDSLRLVGLELLGRVLVNCDELELERCFIAPNIASGSALSNTCANAQTRTTLRSCVVVGAENKGVSATNLRLVNCTIVGNRTNTTYDTAVNSIVNVVPSTAGFVAPPPDDLSAIVGVLPWRDWDLHLRDDSPYRNSGTPETATSYDLDGVTRDREINGARVVSDGAYEFQSYDAFWIGRDAQGADVDSPRFDSNLGWASSRAASVGDLAQPPTGRVRIERSVRFLDAPKSLDRLDLARCARVEYEDSNPSPGSPYDARIGVGAALRCEDDALQKVKLAPGAFAQIHSERLETLALDENAACEISCDANLDELTLGNGASLALVGDRRLLVAENVAITNASIRSQGDDAFGYFAHDPSADLQSLALVRVACVPIQVGVDAFRAEAISPREAKLVWTSTDLNCAPIVQRRDGNDRRELDLTNATRQVDPETNIATFTLITQMANAQEEYLLFDGREVHGDFAWTLANVQFSVAALCVGADEPCINWEVILQMASTSNVVMVGQAITILARIYDAFDHNEALLNDGNNVVSASYTCYYKANGIFGDELEPVQGHVDVDVPIDSVLEALQTSDAWTIDSVGYNFVYTPNTREYPLFAKKGEYQIKVVVNLATGNPIVFYAPISVADRVDA